MITKSLWTFSTKLLHKIAGLSMVIIPNLLNLDTRERSCVSISIIHVGCAETIRWSLLAYMWRFERLIEQRGHLAELRLRYPNVKFVAVCGDKDLKKILEEE